MLAKLKTVPRGQSAISVLCVLLLLGSSLGLMPVGAQAQDADISLTSADITFSNNNPQTGAIITITAKIHNGGPSAASNVVVEYFASNIPVPPTKTIAAIPPTQAVDSTHTWVATVPGTYTIRVRANGDQNDPDPNNNAAERTITVGTIVPTINVTATLSQEQIQSKERFTVTGNAEMGGSPVNGGAVTVEIPQNGYTNDSTTAADGTFSVMMDGPTAQGKYEVKVSVTQGAVTGTTQLNLTVFQPDVTITKFTYAPKEPTEGETVKIDIGVQNIGNGTARNVSFELKIDNVVVKEIMLGDLSNGQTSSVKYSWKAKKGTHDFVAKVDSNNTIEEIKEDNNAWPTQQVTVKAKENKPGPSFEAAIFIVAVLVILFIMRKDNGKNRKQQR